MKKNVRCLPPLKKTEPFAYRMAVNADRTRGEALSTLQRLYACVKSSLEDDIGGKALPELLVAGFDREQIWQQVELQNGDSLRRLRRVWAASAGVASGALRGGAVDGSRSSNDGDAVDITERVVSIGAESDDDDEEDEEEEAAEEAVAGRDARGHGASIYPRASAVDDRFFRLAEMDAFVEAEERKAAQGDRAETFDLDIGDCDDGEEAADSGHSCKFSDFFDPPPSVAKTAAMSDAGESRRVHFDDNDGRLHDEEQSKEVCGAVAASTSASSFEKRQARLRAKIGHLEDENLASKSWQMQGEAVGGERPVNSLLEEHLRFDHAAKLPPTISEETTSRLEALITQRIKDKVRAVLGDARWHRRVWAWDDVERKAPQKVQPRRYREALAPDTTKKSLVQVYEQEFLKQTQKVDEEKTNPKHEEIRTAMHALFEKLDALSNFHYTPKPASTEVRVINNLRSLTREEAAPATASDAALLAPEEIKSAERADLKADAEKSSTERLRQRRLKKSTFRKRAHLGGVADEKGRPKRAARDKIVNSTKFFAELQKTTNLDGANGKRRKLARADKLADAQPSTFYKL